MSVQKWGEGEWIIAHVFMLWGLAIVCGIIVGYLATL